MKNLVVGVDLGGTKIYTALAKNNGRILSETIIPTQATKGKEHVLNLIKESILQTAKEKLKQVKKIGIAAPGPIILADGTVSHAPNLPGWENVPLKKIIEKEFQIPVILENDGNAAALAEGCFGAAKNKKNYIYITVSTGIGGGIVIDGKILHGKNGTAGEFGHMLLSPNGFKCACGNIGDLEAQASGTALKKYALARLAEIKTSSLIWKLCGENPKNITAELIAGAAKQKDKISNEIIDQAILFLSMGIINLVNIFSPEMIIIGGGLSNMGERLIHPLSRIVKKCALSANAKGLIIVKSKLGNQTGVLGAISLCL